MSTPRKPDHKTLNALLESFSEIEFDGVQTVNITREKAGSFWTQDDMDGCEATVNPDTMIVRLETKDGEDYHFREEDLFAGEVVEDPDKNCQALLVKDTEGNERRLIFYIRETAKLSSPTTSQWSGKTPLPKIGATIGAPFAEQTIPVRVTGYFESEGEGVTWIGVRTQPLALPANLERFGLGTAILKELETHGRLAPKREEPLLEIGLFGAETRDCPPLPDWLQESHLGAEEELAALLAIALGGKSWKETLTLTAWCNGHWGRTPYEDLAPPLQRIRNTAHLPFVEAAAKKNSEFITRCKAALRQHSVKSGT